MVMTPPTEKQEHKPAIAPPVQHPEVRFDLIAKDMLREPSNEQPDYKFAGLKERHEDIQRKEKENHASHRPKPFQYENPHHGLREEGQDDYSIATSDVDSIECIEPSEAMKAELGEGRVFLKF